MRNVFKVFGRDIKSIFKNPIAIIIIAGLCVVPSLYAWVNIKACWDPYSNTGTMPVAVVNQDAGATLNGKTINIGNDVINELHSNHNIGWKFVSEADATSGLIDGKYYAMIEIPSNFSKDLASVTTDNPTKAQIIYKVNTKINPVAGKITEVAESTLVDQIKTNFIATVNEEVFSKLNPLGGKIDENKNNIINLKNSIININNNMGLINNVLDGVSTGATNLNSYIDTIKTALPGISSSLSSVESVTVNTNQIINNTNSTLSSAFNNISVNLNTTNANLNNIKQEIAGLESSNVSSEQAKSLIALINNNLNQAKNQVTPVVTFLESINKIHPNNAVEALLNNVKSIEGSLQNQINVVSQGNDIIDQAGKVKESSLNTLNSGINTISNSLNNAINNYDNNTRGQLNAIGSNLSGSTKTAANLVNEANGLVSKIQGVVNSASSNTQLAQSTAASLKSTLSQFSGVISELSKNLGKINNNDLNQIITVLQGNPVVMGNYISEPFTVQQQAIYKIDNYGSGMAPIYSVLAIWVGALLLTSLLKTEPPHFEGVEKISIRERYFGKLLTFMSIVIIQSIIIVLGDKYLLGVQTANLPLFIFAGILTGIIFCIVIFTLVSLLGNFGKSICIVLMVIQIAGTGGTYPVQVLPLFFRIVQPLMPFSYAVDLFREAIAGPLFANVKGDIIALIVFGIVFVLLAYFLKPHTYKRLSKFEKEFEESGIAE